MNKLGLAEEAGEIMHLIYCHGTTHDDEMGRLFIGGTDSPMPGSMMEKGIFSLIAQ